MSRTAKRCQLDGCTRAASTKCYCCQKDVCTKHFLEHIETVKAQLDPLANETNEMLEKIQSLSLDKITESCFTQLQQWKNVMYQLIDEMFASKMKEMEELIAKHSEKFVEHQKQQLEKLKKIQDQVRQLVEDGDATADDIQSMKNQLASVQTNLTGFAKDYLSVNTKLLPQGLVTISSNLNKSTNVALQSGKGRSHARSANEFPHVSATHSSNYVDQMFRRTPIGTAYSSRDVELEDELANHPRTLPMRQSNYE